MSVSTVRTTDLLAEFSAAPRETFLRLAEALWAGGAPAVDAALPAIPEIITHLKGPGGERGYLAILLGLLAESEYPGYGPLHAAVREGLDVYLSLLTHKDDPTTLALVYLLSHFPDDREKILAAVAPLGLDADDRTRLERNLRHLDPASPDLGRVWPSPSVWRLTEQEKEFDRKWISTLTPEQVATNWANDTRTILGYSGAKAYWAVRNGRPLPAEDAGEQAEYVPAPAPDLPAEAFARFGEQLRCPACRTGLTFEESRTHCARCATAYPIARGILDLTEGISATAPADEATAGLLQKLAEMPSMGLYYEAVLRPAFLRIAGANWGGAVTIADEDAYLARHLPTGEGPVLDLAAGAGRWTEVVARTVGADRLIALDLGLPMLTVLRGRLPEVPAVRASALDLPFEDGSMAVVNCWNALQAFPDDAAAAIAEMGRVLRPGGVLTMMTFVFDEDPVARYFQASHFFPSRAEGMLLFEREELHRWLAAAGLKIRHEWTPGTFVFLTAVREAK